MLTFLRKIRRSLIDSGSTGKYLLYAIGEIALVVIGILIALQINTWNEYRKARIKERNILLEIKNTLEQNAKYLENQFNYIESLNKSNDVVLSTLSGQIPYSDSLHFHFENAQWKGYDLDAWISNSGYNLFKI